MVILMKNNTINIAAYNSMLKEKIAEFLKQKLKEVDKEDIVPSYGSLLSAIYNHGGRLQISALYEMLSKPKPTVTEMINRLVLLGYLEKTKCTEDKRVTYVIVTDKAKEFQKHYSDISKELIEKIYEGFTEEEKSEFTKLMIKAIDNFS